MFTYKNVWNIIDEILKQSDITGDNGWDKESSICRIFSLWNNGGIDFAQE